jgi:Tol biopolymer transport system component
MATPTLVSSDKNGNALPGRSGLSSISGDGSLVTFTNLTGDGTSSPFYQVYLKNLVNGDLTAVSVSGDQTQFSRISSDGSNLVFEAAPDPFDFSGFGPAQIYIYNVATSGTTLVTRNTSGQQSDGHLLTDPSISDGGSVVSFDSNANDLVTGVTFSGFSRPDQVYINTGGVNQLITKTATNVAFNDNSWNSYVSADGKFVAFESFASNIGLGATGHEDEVYLYNIATQKLSLVSKTAAGVVANGKTFGSTNTAYGDPVRRCSRPTAATLSSSAPPPTLRPARAMASGTIYWKDTVTGVLKLVSCTAGGTPGNGTCSFITPEGVNYPSVSADGRFVTFASNSTNLVPGAGSNTSGSGHNVVYVKDMVTGGASAPTAVLSRSPTTTLEPRVPATRPTVRSTSPTIRCPATSRSPSAASWSRAPPTTR